MESLAAAGRSAIDSFVQPPDHSKHGLTGIPVGGTPAIIDFIPPPIKGPLRVRRDAHHVDAEYLKKYEKALELMKALPADDPRSFTRQVDLYHAFRDGAYHQIGLPKLDLQFTHTKGPDSRFFFPWHRCYLYFNERILGKLINDDEFSIPFWNSDHSESMVVPDFYNKNRDPSNQATLIIDHDSNPNSGERVKDNLKYMYRSMIFNGKSAEPFTGSPYVEGDETNRDGGSIEKIPHWPAHVRIEEQVNSNDGSMGSFYFSNCDSSFFGCSANVDRLWSTWEAQDGVSMRDCGDPDWLDACFYFHEENRQIVRMKVRDCLDTRKLGYEYETVEIDV